MRYRQVSRECCILAYLTNSVDTDEMPQTVTFHLGLHCLLGHQRYSEKDMQYNLEVITRDPSFMSPFIYVGYPDFIITVFKN